MNRKLILRFGIACFATMLLSLVSCQDKDYYDPDYKPNDNKEASTSAYSTTRTVELQLNYDVTDGYVSTYDVYTENPLNEDGTFKADLKPISGGINIAGINQKRVLPVFASDLYVYSSDLFIPKLMHAKVENGVASFEPYAYLADVSQLGTRTIGDTGVSGIDHFLTKKDDYYQSTSGKKYKYDLKNYAKMHDFPAEVKSSITRAFPDDKYYEDRNLTSPDQSYFQDAVIKIKNNDKADGANIYVSLALADGSYRNSLSYFVYTNEKKDIETLTEAERKNLKLINIFQLADMYNNPWKQNNKGNSYKNQGLTAGKAIKLKYVDNDGNFGDVFPVGAQIAFVLHSDGFKDSFTEIKNATRIYSIAAWNKDQVKKTVFFGAKDNKDRPYSFFGFEDQISAKINDCNDVMFRVETDPIEATEPPKFIPEEGTIEKEVTNYGILAFEDNWPKKGDYDLNDVVVKYNSTVTYVQDGETTEESNGDLVPKDDVITVKRVKDVFSFIHTGAEFNNAFSYKVNISPSKIKEITITDNNNNTVNYTAKADGEGFIIDLCPNVMDVIPAMQEVLDPAIYTVKMEFANKAILEKDFEGFKAPYNPFIIPENNTIQSDMIEVHLPLYPPTSRMDKDLFGRYDDVSKPADNIYYAAAKEVYYPFALHLAGIENFKIPVEEASIDFTYPKYTNWVNNNCGDNDDADWYLYPNP